MWNRNERNGKMDQAKGKVKQAVGVLTHDDKLKAKGKADQTAGRIEVGVGQARRTVGEAVKR